ncbi:fatty aldehyde dehydrogenase [Paraphysoderma sedebokerense]|nr:fatty aldehyde dehydrogenase [Paraphysoderma sedebokerense]
MVQQDTPNPYQEPSQVPPEVPLPEFVETPVAEIAEHVAAVRKTFRSGLTKNLAYRKQQLRQLARLFQENGDAMMCALYKDLRKCCTESKLFEISFTLSEVAEMLANLDEWSKPERQSKPLVNLADSAILRKEPLGVSLIIGAWNYPIHLALGPLVGAIGAGCCAIIKPSEVAPHCAALMADLIPRYLDPSAYRVVNGGIPETTELLKQKFDHIFYTGNGMVGRIVMAAAAKHLTPVTLELGGKSPVVIDDASDIATVARRIVFGKFVNTGQTCIAPDYIICSPATQEKLIPAIQNALTQSFGPDMQSSSFLGRIVNNRHFKRLSKVLETVGKNKDKNDDSTYGGDIAIGGQTDEEDNFIAPTILKNVGWNSVVMQDEIFGPILPIVTVDNVKEEAPEMISDRDHPLALYVFSPSQPFIDHVLDNTNSGGVCVNDTIVHISCPTVPFGGVGGSGTGNYHGKYSFDCFTHKRGVLHKPHGMEMLNNIRYPPWSAQKTEWISWLLFKKVDG